MQSTFRGFELTLYPTLFSLVFLNQVMKTFHLFCSAHELFMKTHRWSCSLTSQTLYLTATWERVWCPSCTNLVSSSRIWRRILSMHSLWRRCGFNVLHGRCTTFAWEFWALDVATAFDLVLHILELLQLGKIMAIRPSSKHLDFEADISWASDSLGYILKSEQEQCLKKLKLIKMYLSHCPLVLVSLSATYYYLGRSIFPKRIT